MKRLFQVDLVLSITLIALVSMGWGIYQATRSSLFLIQLIEVKETVSDSPLDAHAIYQLLDLPLGKVSIFQLNLKTVETRLLANEWIHKVHLQKRLPRTLSVSVDFRKPQALVQFQNEFLAYVDSSGKIFGQVNLMYQADLPLLMGFFSQVPPNNRIEEALQILEKWKNSPLHRISQIASLTWDFNRGFRAWVVYSTHTKRRRTLVELGQEIDDKVGRRFYHLFNVFKYISQHSISVRQIWVDADKKIVVKTVHDS